MPCPKCDSHKLWDDMLWWGCRMCDFMSNTVHNVGGKNRKGKEDEWE